MTTAIDYLKTTASYITHGSFFHLTNLHSYYNCYRRSMLGYSDHC